MSKIKGKSKGAVLGNNSENNVIVSPVEATGTEQEKAKALAEAAAEAELAKTLASKAGEEEIPNSYTTENGRVYVLSPRTPKTLAVLEDVYTQEELLKNKEAMEFLILGDSGFVKRIK